VQHRFRGRIDGDPPGLEPEKTGDQDPEGEDNPPAAVDDPGKVAEIAFDPFSLWGLRTCQLLLKRRCPFCPGSVADSVLKWQQVDISGSIPTTWHMLSRMKSERQMPKPFFGGLC
jgi:hypothetical protein